MISPVGAAAALVVLRRRTFGTYFAGSALSAGGTWFGAPSPRRSPSPAGVGTRRRMFATLLILGGGSSPE